MDYWSPRAYLNVGDNLNGKVTFYAVNGWLDIITSGYTGRRFIDITDGTMHCKQNYTELCSFSQEECICNNPTLTHSQDGNGSNHPYDNGNNSILNTENDVFGTDVSLS